MNISINNQLKSFLKFEELDISALSVGLMTNLSPEEEMEKINLYSEAFELGINSFDTAPNYQDGYSDIFLGKLSKSLGREKLFISSKVFFPNAYSKEQSLSPKHISQSLEGTLKAINTDYVDCLFLHRFDPLTPINETLLALEKLYEAGKFKSWGISAFTLEEILDFYHLSSKFKLPYPKFGQFAYNLFNRSIEKEYNSVFENKDIKIFSYYPLAQGVLTGKYSNGVGSGRNEDPVFKNHMWDLTPEKIQKVKELKDYCGENQIDMISLCYLWCMNNQNVVSLLTNFRNKDQLYHNITCFKLGFNSEIKTTLDAIFKNKPINQYTGQSYGIRERTL